MAVTSLNSGGDGGTLSRGHSFRDQRFIDGTHVQDDHRSDPGRVGTLATPAARQFAVASISFISVSSDVSPASHGC